jgi:anti-sigma regulatory factor (Ser/Thr protein kinase)/putative methionine-R-sulfoxide reductase with GAF domain
LARVNARSPDAESAPQALQPGRGQVILGSSAVAPEDVAPEQMAHIYRLGDPALSELPLDPLLDELLLRVVDILRVDTVAILLYDPSTHELVARAAKGLEEEVERGVRIPLGRGFAGRIAAGRVPITILDVDHAEVLNPILREKHIQSMLGVPLIAEGDLLGVLHVGSLTTRAFSNEDAVLLQLAAARAAPAIERARLMDALQREHSSAVALQRSLLPDRLPIVVGVPVAARYLPSRDEVGGDWYDVLPLARGAVGIAIGDVAGHGVPAAATMADLRSAMRAYALDGHPPSAVLERVDRLLRTVRRDAMATAVYALFDPETGALRYATAGHPPPLRVPASGAPELLPVEPVPPLGTVPYAGYPEQEVQLDGGDTVVFYTDGLIEVRGEPISLGLQRLRDAAAGTVGAEALCRTLTRQLVPLHGGADDIAIVAVHNEPVPERLALMLIAQPDTLADVRRALRRWLRARGAGDDDVATITLAVGEACANAVEHAYAPSPATYAVEATAEGRTVTIVVRDTGHWRLPRGANRGRGLTIMENAMDDLDVRQAEDGTEVVMTRDLRGV